MSGASGEAEGGPELRALCVCPAGSPRWWYKASAPDAARQPLHPRMQALRPRRWDWLSPSPHQASPSCPAGGVPASARPQPISPLISHTCERSCGPPGRRKSSALHRSRGLRLV